MATDNKAVTCYLPPELEKSITEHCVKNGLLRKDKQGLDRPAFGTAIIQILSSYFSIDTSDKSSFSELKEQIEKAVTEKVMDKVNDYYNAINEDIDERIRSNSNSETQNQIDSLVEEVFELKKKIKSIRKKESFTSNGSKSDLEEKKEKSQVEIPLNLEESNNKKAQFKEQNKFAIPGLKLSTLRFGVHKDYIAHKKRKLTTDEFRDWTKAKDPDNIPWKYIKGIGYIPDIELIKEQKEKLQKWFEENIW